MHDEDYEEFNDDIASYQNPKEIEPMALSESLRRIVFLDDDIYLRLQAINIGLVDKFIMDLEYKVLRDHFEMERTPPETFFLSAQSQMWIFAIYELLRTWQERAKEIIKLSKNCSVHTKLNALKEKVYDYEHFSHNNQMRRFEEVLANPSLIDTLKNQLSHLHTPFTYLEHIRVSLAKHEVSGRPKSVALSPGYGRINNLCGSLDYELENGYFSLGTISRRDIADMIRNIDFNTEPPTEEQQKMLEKCLAGKLV
ncbi:hypothetical protein [Janthinobacterium rivuli]|uniref:hypothetical protein n=1 Tax=Janthinobacterium rivuli TaxID=2751478 RepID=UPI00383ADFA2